MADAIGLLDDNCETVDGSDDRHPVRPGGFCYKYAKFLARFWFVVCLLVFVIVTACGVVTFKVYDLPDFSEPQKGFEARGTVITSRAFSLLHLMRDNDLLVPRPSDADVNQGNFSKTSGSFKFRGPRTVDNKPLVPAGQSHSSTDAQSDTMVKSSDLEPTSSTGIQFCSLILYKDQYSVSTMVFEGVDGTNVLTIEAIKSVCEAEKRLVTSHPAYTSNCGCSFQGSGDCPTWSIGNYVALLANKTSCADIEQEDVRRATDLLALCAPYRNISREDLINHNLPKNLPDECIQHNYAAFAILHYLLPIAFSQNIDGQTALSSPICEVLFPITDSDALETIFKESVEKKSDTDGITRLKAVSFHIKFELFSDLLISDSMYMAISAGAIFLLIWVYTGSLLVAIVAFLNIVFSLVLADFCYTVVFVRPFFPFGNIITVILMLGVGADDTFVYMDLWKKTKSEMGDRDIPGLVCETLRHASATMIVTSLTTAAALYATVFSHITAVKCFAVFAGTGIIMNLVLTLTLLPAVIVMQHKLTTWCCSLKFCSQSCPSKGNGCLKSLSQRVKMVYEDLIPFLVLKLRFVWIVLFLLLMTGGAVVVFYYPRFRLPSSAEFQLFVSSHYFEQYDFVYKEQFAFSQETFYDAGGSVTWGVQAVDNGNTWDPDDQGTLLLDDGFKFSSLEDQAWLLNFCQDLRKQAFYRSEPLYCFIEHFVDFMQNPRCKRFGIDLSPCCNQSESTYSPSLFETCMAKFADVSFSYQQVFFRKTDAKLAVIKIDFRTIFPSSYNFAKNEEFWVNVNTWVEDKLESAPKSLQRGWFVGTYGGLLFYDLQQSLATGTRNSMVITLAVASGILLLAMRNLLLTLLSMLTIASAVFVTVASLVLLGWELNIVEATIITLAVGLSVDFTIHYGVAYKLSPSDTRRQRARYSLTTMTPAITLAAFSTFLAGALVLPSTLLTYNRFAIFLMLVMSISWAHGTFFFQSLCMAIGPQGSCGDIPGLSKCGCSKQETGNDQPEQEQTSMHTYDNHVETNVLSDDVDFILGTDQALPPEQNYSMSL